MENNSIVTKIGQLFKQSLRITGQYFKARLLVCLILGALASVIYWFIGIPAFWAFGLVVGLANLIPIFGPWGSAVLVGVVLLFIEPIWALYALFVILATQVLDEFILTPLLLKQAIDLKPLTILIVVMLAGAFCGFWGILFALPVAACIKAAYKLFFAKPALKGDSPDVDDIPTNAPADDWHNSDSTGEH